MVSCLSLNYFNMLVNFFKVDVDLKVWIWKLIKCFNYWVKIIELFYGKVDVKEFVNIGLFNFEVVQIGYGWLQDFYEMIVCEVNGCNVVIFKLEMEEYNVNNFVYICQRLFYF